MTIHYLHWLTFSSNRKKAFYCANTIHHISNHLHTVEMDQRQITLLPSSWSLDFTSQLQITNAWDFEWSELNRPQLAIYYAVVFFLILLTICQNRRSIQIVKVVQIIQSNLLLTANNKIYHLVAFFIPFWMRNLSIVIKLIDSVTSKKMPFIFISPSF